MKIVIFTPKNEFTKTQQEVLKNLGDIVYLDSPMEHPLEELIDLAKGAHILAVDPDNFGGFETAREKLITLLETLPSLKGLALDTTSFGWVDLDYCKKRNIVVSNCPGWSRESIAEHTLALLLSLAKRIIVTDRKTQNGTYQLVEGFELRGKTLGIIGLGSIGSRVAELGLAIGMRVIAYNHSPKQQTGVEMKSLEEVLKESDAISLHTTHEDKNKNLIGKEELEKMKKGVIIVNLVDRDLVDEEAMAKALTSGKVGSYAYEGEDLQNTPLVTVENAIGIKGFGWYTKEALKNLFEIWVENIASMGKGKPRNVIN